MHERTGAVRASPIRRDGRDRSTTSVRYDSAQRPAGRSVPFRPRPSSERIAADMVVATTSQASSCVHLRPRSALAFQNPHFRKSLRGKALITKPLLCQLSYGGSPCQVAESGRFRPLSSPVRSAVRKVVAGCKKTEEPPAGATGTHSPALYQTAAEFRHGQATRRHYERQ
jgi:hypothetical protein